MNNLVKLVFYSLLSKAAQASVSVEVDGTNYESFGLVGFGRIPADLVDKYSETVAPGSSLQIQQSSVTVDSDGTYHFTAWGLPDRGMNVDGTVNTFSRIHKFSVDFTPLNESSTDNVIWTYEDTILLTDFNGDYFSGLDANTTVNYNGLQVPAVVYKGDGWGNNMNSSTTTTRISLDSESLTFIDGNIENGFWIGDEYGPSLFKFDSTGKMTDYLEAPGALLPHVNGELFFSSDSTLWTDQDYSVEENENGRSANHGYEGMDITPDGKYLFTLLQAATVQDGGDKSKHRMNTRLLKYDLTSSTPELVGEYVVVLPTYEKDGKTKTASQSEMRVISENLILVLPRDSHFGRDGEDGTTALFKHVDLWSLTEADNILGQYDDVGDQISSSKGKLNSDITPATHYSFIDLLDETELAKFGLHNGGPDNAHLLNEKWEGMALMPVQCTTDEYFLVLISDNDYKTTNGYLDYGKMTFDLDADIDTQNMVYHIKLPSLPHDESCTVSSSSKQSSSSISSSAAISSSIVSSSTAVSSPPVSSSSASSLTSEPISSSSQPSTSSFVSLRPYVSSASTLTVSEGTTVTEPCEKCSVSTEYTTYTTVTDGTTQTVIVPCSTTTFSSGTGSGVLPTSYTTYTTVTNGVTTTITEPCSSTESVTNVESTISSSTTLASTSAPVSSSAESGSSSVVSTYEGLGIQLDANTVFPAVAAIFAALL